MKLFIVYPLYVEEQKENLCDLEKKGRVKGMGIQGDKQESGILFSLLLFCLVWVLTNFQLYAEFIVLIPIRQTERNTERQTERQTDWQTERQTDRQT